MEVEKTGSHFADRIFKRMFLYDFVLNSDSYCSEIVPNGPINNNLSLAKVMAWRRKGNKPLSELIIV